MSDVGTRPGVIKSDRQNMREEVAAGCADRIGICLMRPWSPFPAPSRTPDSGDNRGIFELVMP